MPLRPEVPDPLPCGDTTCDECRPLRPGLAAQVLDGRGAE